jgi:transcription elongation factor Elf1
MQYGYDKLGSLDKLKCSDCGQQQERNELRLSSRYDGYDEQGDPIWIEDYFGCWVCHSDNVNEV